MIVSIRNFFWNKAKDGEGIVNMFQLLLGTRCRLKSEIGLGLIIQRTPFLAKHAGKILRQPDSTWAKLIRAKYLKI